MKLTQGCTHIYFGKGKGKTSAAVGLAIRARGAGLKVCFFQFLKGRRDASSEIKILKKSGVETVVFNQRHPMFGGYAKELKKSMPKDLSAVKKIVTNKRFDTIVLDEVLNAVSEGFLTAGSLIEIIKARGESTELVLTGIKAPQAILKYGDYITHFKYISHPYEHHVCARKGIEY